MSIIGIALNERYGMVFGSDFNCVIKNLVIENAQFFVKGKEKHIENVRINNRDFSLIVEQINRVINLLIEKPKAKRIDPNVHILDGGDYFSLELYFLDNGNIIKKEYGYLNDRRFFTITEMIKKLVMKDKREIIIYDDPVVDGIYVTYLTRGKQGYYSYQFTLADRLESNTKRYFFAYFDNDNSICSVSKFDLDEKIWNKTKELIDTLDLDDDGNDKFKLELYYSDGSQKSFIPNKKYVKIFDDFFQSLI